MRKRRLPDSVIAEEIKRVGALMCAPTEVYRRLMLKYQVKLRL